MLALTSAPAPMVSVSCAEISPSTCPSIRPVPSNTSLPVTRVPFPRNASMPPGPVVWLAPRSRSPIATSSGAIPPTRMPDAGITSRSFANSPMEMVAGDSKFETDPARRPSPAERDVAVLHQRDADLLVDEPHVAVVAQHVEPPQVRHELDVLVVLPERRHDRGRWQGRARRDAHLADGRPLDAAALDHDAVAVG